MTPRTPPRYAPPSPPPPHMTDRQRRVYTSLHRLRTHPAVNTAGAHGPYGVVPPPGRALPPTAPASRARSPSPDPTNEKAVVPPAIFQALFDDLVRRELGVDPGQTRAELAQLVDRDLMRNRSIAPKPSLSDPLLVHRLASSHHPRLLSDKDAIAAVMPSPLDTKLYIPGAAEIHLAIKQARLQKKKHSAKKRSTSAKSKAQKSPAAIRRSTRKRKHDEIAETEANGQPNARDDVEIPDKDALKKAHQNADVDTAPPPASAQSPKASPTPAPARNTRSVAKKPRRSVGPGCRSECCLCPDPALYDNNELSSELIGPFVDNKGVAQLFVHFDCACWAPQVFADSRSGQLRRVYEEYLRGRQLKCSECGGRGATIGCYIQKCKQVFHFRCLARAGARRVENFFVAYCSNHAHLGEKASYKILMEAATIADIAASHRREDTTYGLDAPHSRYTLLRRRETEVIFSRSWRVSSHNGAFETQTVVFSHRRRRVLNKNEKLSLNERPRALLVSAVDVASGRLAYMAVAGKEEKTEDMSAVEARAALASRENTGLLLLRNLRRAPRWTKDQIKVVKNSAKDNSTQDAEVTTDQQAQSSLAAKSTHARGKAGKSVRGPTGKQSAKKQPNRSSRRRSDTGTATKSPPDVSPSHRKSPRRRKVGGASSSSDADIPGVADKNNRTPLPSARLPAFKKRPPKDSTDVKQQADSSSESPSASHAADASCGANLHGRTVPADRASVKDDPKCDGVHADAAAAISSGRQGLTGKVMSAWETFLEEHLPKERLLRPDDPVSDALNNMARLWSLLTVEERDAYEERARLSGTVTGGSLNMGSSAEARRNMPAEIKAKETKASAFEGDRVRNAGLFGSSSAGPGAAVTNARGKTSKASAKSRQGSVSLPRGSKFQEELNSSSLRGGLASVDWDDLLPTGLEDGVDAAVKASGNLKGSNPSPHVLAPPPPRGSCL